MFGLGGDTGKTGEFRNHVWTQLDAPNEKVGLVGLVAAVGIIDFFCPWLLTHYGSPSGDGPPSYFSMALLAARVGRNDVATTLRLLCWDQTWGLLELFKFR